MKGFSSVICLVAPTQRVSLELINWSDTSKKCSITLRDGYMKDQQHSKNRLDEAVGSCDMKDVYENECASSKVLVLT
jgi:hypothetical protein